MTLPERKPFFPPPNPDEDAPFQAIVEQSPDAIVVHNPDGRILYANPAALTLLGESSLEEAKKRSIFDHLPPAIVEDSRQAIRRLLEGDSLPSFVAPLFLVNGDQIDVEVKANLVQFENRPSIQIHLRDVTDRKQMAMALQESEEKFRMLIQASLDGIILNDDQGVIVEWNPGMERIFGIPRMDAIGRTLQEIAFRVAPDMRKEDDAEQWIQSVITRMDQEPLSSEIPLIEVSVRRPDGSMGCIEVVNFHFTSSDRLFYGGIVRDITDRKRAEEALKESEEKYRNLVEESLQTLVIIQDGRITYANRQAEEFGGYSRAEFLAMPPEAVLQFVHPEDRPLVAQRIRDRLGGKDEPPRYEVRFLRRDGEVRWADMHVSLVQYQGRRAQQVMLVDITDQKRIEAARHESEEKYRTLIEKSPDAIVIHDGGTILYANPATAHLLQASDPGDLIGKNSFTVIHPDSQAISRTVAKKDREGIPSPPTEIQVIRKDGSIITLEGRGRRIQYQGKTAVEVILRDVTERKKAEQQLREYAENLRRSNEDLELFVHIATHDLQEPIRGVVAFSQILLSQCHDGICPSPEDYLRRIESAGLRMHTLVNDLRIYSNVGAAKKPREWTDLEEVLSSALENLHLVIRDTRATVTHDPLPTIWAERIRMIQLFQNLIDNALKFRRKDVVPEVHLSVVQIPSEGMWKFSVKDNGIGIAPEYFDKIFILFERLHGRDTIPGTGLGLALCKRIVEEHGGRIWVESEVMKGSTFSFTLPEGKSPSGEDMIS
ncbi:MAG: PAS domain S-box protein [Methanoregulaceae archaeon]|jgi:PAS domain S-box-containing protein|nr:PAS domain S-box protein [Methanoregulaceae archaeon]